MSDNDPQFETLADAVADVVMKLGEGARGPWGVWKLMDEANGRFLVHTRVNGDDGYWVPIDEIKSPLGMLGWIEQIAEKGDDWMPSVDVGDFVRAVMALGIMDRSPTG